MKVCARLTFCGAKNHVVGADKTFALAGKLSVFLLSSCWICADWLFYCMSLSAVGNVYTVYVCNPHAPLPGRQPIFSFVNQSVNHTQPLFVTVHKVDIWLVRRSKSHPLHARVWVSQNSRVKTTVYGQNSRVRAVEWEQRSEQTRDTDEQIRTTVVNTLNNH